MNKQTLESLIPTTLLRGIIAALQRRLKQDVLIFVNKGNRDALGLLLVYAYLRYVYGLRVKIHSGVYLSDFWADLYRPTAVIYLSPDCPAIVDMYEELGRMGSARLMWPTETIAARYNEPFFAGKYEYKHLLEGVLLPSGAMRDLLLRHGKIGEAQAHVVGNPTLDWSVAPLNRLFISRKAFCRKHRLPEGRRWILLATSFDWADLDATNYDRLYSHFNLPKEKVLQDKAIIEKLRTRTIEYFTALLAKHPEWQLLIKAHPFEDRTVYERAWGRHPRVTSVHGEEIYELIANAEVLVHWNSTTSVQAWGFGKPTILLNFEEARELCGGELGDFQKGHYVCETLEDLERAIQRSLKEGQPNAEQLEARKNFVEEWCYRLDGKSASRMAKVVSDLCEERRAAKITSLSSVGRLVRGMGQTLQYKQRLYLAWLCSKFRLCPKSVLDQLSLDYDSFNLEFHKFRYERRLRALLKGEVKAYASEVTGPRRSSTAWF